MSWIIGLLLAACVLAGLLKLFSSKFVYFTIPLICWAMMGLILYAILEEISISINPAANYHTRALTFALIGSGIAMLPIWVKAYAMYKLDKLDGR